MHDEKTRIAEGAFCTVDACECGVFHVTLGPITVRLQSDVVESIWVTLGEAIQRMEARRTVPPILRERAS